MVSTISYEEVSSTQRSCATLWRFRIIVWMVVSHQINNLCLTIKIVLPIQNWTTWMRRLGDSPTKRPFGYFCGSGQKLPAQQSGIKVGNTKCLSGACIPRRPEGRPTISYEEVSSTRRSCATLWRFRVINRKTFTNRKANLCLTIKVVLLIQNWTKWMRRLGDSPTKRPFGYFYGSG